MYLSNKIFLNSTKLFQNDQWGSTDDGLYFFLYVSSLLSMYSDVSLCVCFWFKYTAAKACGQPLPLTL